VPPQVLYYTYYLTPETSVTVNFFNITVIYSTNLVHLTLEESPDSGYIPPEAIVTSLAVMANLKSLVIGPAFPPSLFDQEGQSPPPPTCNVLHSLTCFKFKGDSEYLEDLVARIDAHLLDFIQIVLFDRLAVNFPQLTRLMRCATKFQAPNEVCVYFIPDGIQIKSLPPRGGSHKEYRLEIIFRMLIWGHLPLVKKVFASFLPSICIDTVCLLPCSYHSIHPTCWLKQEIMPQCAKQNTVDHLYIFCTPYLVSKFNATHMRWLDIFHPFIAVKNFYVCQELAQWFNLWERSADVTVLPALETLFLKRPQPSGGTHRQEAIEQFVCPATETRPSCSRFSLGRDRWSVPGPLVVIHRSMVSSYRPASHFSFDFRDIDSYIFVNTTVISSCFMLTCRVKLDSA
jgi:hypothetical protein